MEKHLMIDFLYLDLHTCERCMAVDDTLCEALEELSSVLDTLEYKVNVNKVEITTRELAYQYRFISSPTIRVNGKDICNKVLENDCGCCSDICGDRVDCRVFEYEGSQFEQPPKAMIVDGILKAIYLPVSISEEEYVLPDNLERFFSGVEVSNNKKEGPFMKTMQIFEPAMCCSTGLCGVSVDPELLRVSTVLNTLKQKNITVERFNLTSDPMEFVNNKAVNDFINQFGPEKLPVTMVDGTIIISGRYPTNEEFTAWLDLPPALLGQQTGGKAPAETSGGCNCKGGCC